MNKQEKLGFNDLLDVFKAEGINPKLDSTRFEQEYQETMERKTPVLVQVLMFLGAMLAAGFFLGFLALLDVFNSEIGVMLLGVIITVGAVALPYILKQETTVEPFSLAALIVGCSLFSAGYAFFGNDGFTGFLIISFLVALVIAIVSGSHLQKISAILCANFCFYWLLWQWNFLVGYNFQVLINAIIITVAWVKEPEILSQNPKIGQWYAAILNGCSISMVGVLIGSVNIAQDWHWRETEVVSSHWWLSSILLVALVLWTLHDTLDLIGERKKKLLILGATGLGMMILVTAPGIVAGILLLFLGVFSGYRLFIVQGILAVFFFTIMFYYNMETSLLNKSLLMAGSGLSFLAIGYFIKTMHDREASLITQI